MSDSFSFFDPEEGDHAPDRNPPNEPSSNDSSSKNPGGDDQSSPGYGGCERFFRGLAESIFQTELGVVDVNLVDYIGDLLMRFVRNDAIYGVRRSTGQPATAVFEMLCEAEARVGLARRAVHRHIGDFTLFWSGMYPEALRRHPSPRKADEFLEYCDHGKRAYAIAAEIEAGEDRPSGEVLQRLSMDFEMCAFGLREVRRQWEEGDDSGSDRLLLN